MHRCFTCPFDSPAFPRCPGTPHCFSFNDALCPAQEGGHSLWSALCSGSAPLCRENMAPTAGTWWSGSSLFQSFFYHILNNLLLVMCHDANFDICADINESEASVLCSNVMRCLYALSSPSPDSAVHCPPLALRWWTHPNPQAAGWRSTVTLWPEMPYRQ